MKLFNQLSIAALLLALSVTAYAQPGGWTAETGNKHKSDAVAAADDAIHRGGALYVDTATLQQELLPWTDADGDSITIDFVLPGPLSGCAETPVGWECDVDGSTWRAGVADLDGVKGLGRLSTALDSFVYPGAQSYIRVPVGEVPAAGEFRIQKQLGGAWEAFTYNLQPDEATLQALFPGETVNRLFPSGGDIAIYHKTKIHDITGVGNYMTGKAAHLPPPIAVGFRSNQTTVTGWTYGTWEINLSTGVLTKVFDAAIIQGWSAQTSSVVADLTLGYTNVGGSSGSNGLSPRTISWGLPALGENVFISPVGGMRVSQLSYYATVFSPPVDSDATYMSLHENVTPGDDDDFDYIPNSLCTLGAISGSPASGWLQSAPDSTTFDIAVGKEFTFTFAYGTPNGHRLGYTFDLIAATNSDYTGWAASERYQASDVTDVSTGLALRVGGNNAALSQYLTYEAIPAGGGASDSGPLNLGIGLGL